MRIKRISKVAMVALVAVVLIACVGGYAYWSVQQNVTGNELSSGSMTMSVVDDGQTTITPINIDGIMPGDSGLAATWKVTIGAAPSSGDDLIVSVSNVADTVSLADNVQVALLVCTGGSYNWWLTPSGPVALGAETPDVSFINHVYKMSDFNGLSFADMQGYTELHSGDFRHIKVYYALPLDCASDCHDDSATFDVRVEAVQHH